MTNPTEGKRDGKLVIPGLTAYLPRAESRGREARNLCYPTYNQPVGAYCICPLPETRTPNPTLTQTVIPGLTAYLPRAESRGS